ncbi:hypothetical protein CH63R_01942 [Colletotrichum higginsianum IMI 349063]|uniref:Uncharacterized protein n=1 Tax=Colletotrichum higginsianum (strain IMI 349063) TaxID=759273 RepID=A0A1B7YMD8_COLHI|nr:hypothetical protein CH63R_01942 [Colletotrichum higginsianum IMI 349063]OBR13216.1 hypothetical protein CH63R_01942 [Colletotrichum higginsianum IMI 349063]
MSSRTQVGGGFGHLFPRLFTPTEASGSSEAEREWMGRRLGDNFNPGFYRLKYWWTHPSSPNPRVAYQSTMNITGRCVNLSHYANSTSRNQQKSLNSPHESSPLMAHIPRTPSSVPAAATATSIWRTTGTARGGVRGPRGRARKDGRRGPGRPASAKPSRMTGLARHVDRRLGSTFIVLTGVDRSVMYRREVPNPVARLRRLAAPVTWSQTVGDVNCGLARIRISVSRKALPSLPGSNARNAQRGTSYRSGVTSSRPTLNVSYSYPTRGSSPHHVKKKEEETKKKENNNNNSSFENRRDDLPRHEDQAAAAGSHVRLPALVPRAAPGKAGPPGIAAVRHGQLVTRHAVDEAAPAALPAAPAARPEVGPDFEVGPVLKVGARGPPDDVLILADNSSVGARAVLTDLTVLAGLAAGQAVGEVEGGVVGFIVSRYL